MKRTFCPDDVVAAITRPMRPRELASLFGPEVHPVLADLVREGRIARDRAWFKPLGWPRYAASAVVKPPPPPPAPTTRIRDHRRREEEHEMFEVKWLKERLSRGQTWSVSELAKSLNMGKYTNALERRLEELREVGEADCDGGHWRAGPNLPVRRR